MRFLLGVLAQMIGIVLMLCSGLVLGSAMFFTEDDWTLVNISILIVSALIMALGIWLHFRSQRL